MESKVGKVEDKPDYERLEEKYRKEAEEDNLWYESLYDIGGHRHLLNGESGPDNWEKMRKLIEEKWDVTIQKKSHEKAPR